MKLKIVAIALALLAVAPLCRSTTLHVGAQERQPEQPDLPRLCVTEPVELYRLDCKDGVQIVAMACSTEQPIPYHFMVWDDPRQCTGAPAQNQLQTHTLFVPVVSWCDKGFLVDGHCTWLGPPPQK